MKPYFPDTRISVPIADPSSEPPSPSDFVFPGMSLALPIAEQGHWADELARRSAEAGTVVFMHIGFLDRPELERLVQLSEDHCREMAVGVATRQRLVNLLVEGLENIRHHIPADLATTAFALLVGGV